MQQQSENEERQVQNKKKEKENNNLTVKPLKESDLAEAARITRLAFGTFLGLPDPAQMFGDREVIRYRWLNDPSSVFGAYTDNGTLAGINVATRWGSFGFFGPLTVRPDLWGTGIAKALMPPVLEYFSKWGTTHQGLFTFAQSAKHIALYQKFGFYPRFLTAIMVLDLSTETGRSVPRTSSHHNHLLFSEVKDERVRSELLASTRDEVTDKVYEGLDLSSEILTVNKYTLGDTIFLKEKEGDDDDGSAKINGLVVCHVGPGTEAGSGSCYVKFGAVKPGPRARENFARLLDGVALLALNRGATRVEAGVNLARRGAYEEMLKRGFRAEFQGVAMQSPNDDPGFNRGDVFAMDDWR